MQRLAASVSLLGALAHLAQAATIIGYDGKEINYGTHRDGLHDRALHQRDHHGRRHLSHARLRHFDARHVHHMLNQHAPVAAKQHNLRSVSHRHRVSARAVEPANSTRNVTLDSGTALSRIEKNMLDSVYGVEEVKLSEHAAKGGDKKAQKEEASHGVKVEGSAPAPAAGPAPAPAPVGSPAGSPADEDEEDKPSPMMTMDEDMGAKEQGFSGDIVEHDNGKTMTKDWRGEYGPGTDGESDYVKICELYPDNQWCHDRGYHRTTPAPPKSAAARTAAGLMAVVLLGGCALA